MAYVDTLLAAYKNANGGVEADAASKLAIGSYAQQVELGKDTPDGALSKTLALNSDTTAVVLATYQFFTGSAPSAAGLTYFLNSSTNTNDLNDTGGLYASFNQESRFINFSINLALGSSSAAQFATDYGSVTIAQTVSTAYNKIIGNSVAQAAGVDVDAAVAWLSRQSNITALTGFVRANNPTFTTAQVDLAVKAALIGQILNIAVSNSLGGYAEAINAAIKDYSDDGALTGNTDAGINLIVAYPPTGSTGETKNLTADIDTLTGTSGNDSYTGVWDGVAAGNKTTINALDTIGGAGGNDSLTINALQNLTTADLASVTITSIETINLRGAQDIGFDSSAYADVTALNVKQAVNVDVDAAGTTAVSVTNATGSIQVDGGSTVTVADSTTNNNITIGANEASTGAVTVTDANLGNGSIDVSGGTDISVTATKATNGSISVGDTGDRPTGAVVINTTGVAYNATGQTTADVTVRGGTTVVVNATATTSTAAAATATNVGNEITQANIDIHAYDSNTSVTVNQSAPVDAVNAVAAAGAQEVQTITFAAITAGQTVTINGLTFTAAVNLTAAQVASAFANVKNGGVQGSASNSLGTYTGAFNGQAGSTGAVTTTGTTSTVTYTGTAVSGSQGLLTPTGTATTLPTVVEVTDGVTFVDAVTGVAGIIGGEVYIDSHATTDKVATVSLAGYGGTGSTIESNALKTLNLKDSHNSTLTVTSTATSLALGLNNVGYVNAAGAKVFSTVDLGASYTTLNVAASGANSYTTLAAGGVTALTVSGDKTVDFGTTSLGALKTVVVTGSAGVSLNASGANVTSVDTTGTTGSNTFTINAATATYAGGAGKDTVTLSSTTVTKNVTLGAGDDVLKLATGTTSVTGVLSGGDGIDTLEVAAADAATLSASNAFEAKFNGFEKLGVRALASNTTNTVDIANLNDINYVVSAGGFAQNQSSTVTITRGTVEAGDTFAFTIGTTTVTYTTNGTDTANDVATQLANQITLAGIGVTSSVAGGVITLTSPTAFTITGTTATNGGATADSSTVAATAIAAGTPAGTLALTNFVAGGTLELTGAAANTSVALVDATGTSDVLNLITKNGGNINFGTVTAAGVETIAITATDSTPTTINTHTVSLADAALKTVTIGGNAKVVLTHNSDALTSIDASANTGGVTATTLATAGAAATITGGSGADTLTALHSNDVLIGGAGADVLKVGAGANLVTLTGGAGADTFQILGAAANVNSYATITDGTAGDIIKFVDSAGPESFTSAKLALGGTAVFQDFANLAIASTDTGAITWFQFGGDTYVVENISNNASAFVNGTDIIVKLAGPVDLSTASFSATSQTLVLA
ncbi:hypothetical protein [Caulobacter sp. RHG1]|uniref:beta strand repeat-containing protein n=1 Tax=Caulobacter sp. (strain RHG1) TaxID=2545762 RepID=UPI001552F87B|nr:hypothetical protein [Caulobacter sp. RHG1]NQE60878.1 hypothetical protein [Caulobacter sp. RHG1]